MDAPKIKPYKKLRKIIYKVNNLKSYEKRYKIYKEIYSANKSILREISVLN
jgi:hypothetical protein